MDITLLYDYFSAASVERQQELDYCLRQNLSLDFSRIILFGDKQFSGIDSKMVVRIPLQERLTFSDFLEYVHANRNSEGIAVFTNSDIVIDKTLIDSVSQLKFGVVLAISRYESIDTLANDPWCTQDTWVLRLQPIHISARLSTKFPLGKPGCELRFAEALYSVGFSIFNPCLSIRNLHVHSLASNHNDEFRLYGSYIFTPPCLMEQAANNDQSVIGRLVYLRRDSITEVARQN